MYVDMQINGEKVKVNIQICQKLSQNTTTNT